jgi:hypothetical protein
MSRQKRTPIYRKVVAFSHSPDMRCFFVVGFVFAALISGCTTYNVEYDRMTGTDYPPAQSVSSKTITLASIYADAGYILTVDEDTTNIAPLAGPPDPSDPDQYDYITEAELDTVETANRSTQVGPVSWPCGFWIFKGTCTQYHLYGVVANHYYEYSDGTRDKGIMGIMWTADRSAFANFYKNATVSSDGGKYLRSAAHEIGHAFNLHHEDGDGSTTIMNQTWKVGNNYVYEFSSASKTHLKDHPGTCVRPGVGTFGSINKAHTDHGWTTTDCN